MSFTQTNVGNDGVLVTGMNNQSSNPFNLQGGKYGVVAAGTFSTTNAVLQKVGPDGSTLVAVQTFTANGYAALYLPPGQYQISGTSTSFAMSVQKIKAS